MNIWIDICHMPQFNFCINLIKMLAAKPGNHVYITVLDRGRLAKIVRKDLASLEHISIDVIGRHNMTTKSAIWDANIKRIFQLYAWARRNKVEVSIAPNTIPCALVSKLLGIPCYIYADDATRHTYKYVAGLCTRVINTCVPVPTHSEKYTNKIDVVNALKEWAYLAPNVFKHDVHALDAYEVKPKEYIFLREVSVGTINYASQSPQAILAVKDLIAETGLKVLFSLEEKNRRGEYPEDWILLQEPIEDIHSLMYYSAGLVSSGDSMAREAALLGIPAYYLGTRHSMPANLAAAKVAGLQNELTMPFSEWLGRLTMNVERLTKEQEELRRKIDADFIDINEYMMSLVEKSAKVARRSFWKEAWTWIRTPKSYELNQCAKDLEYK